MAREGRVKTSAMIKNPAEAASAGFLISTCQVDQALSTLAGSIFTPGPMVEDRATRWT